MAGAILVGLVPCQFTLGVEAEPTLHETVDYLNLALAACPGGFSQMIEPGEVSMHAVDGVTYLWYEVTGHNPSWSGTHHHIDDVKPDDAPHRVRFSLADMTLDVRSQSARTWQFVGTPVEVTVVTATCSMAGCVEVMDEGRLKEGTDERLSYRDAKADRYHFFVCEGHPVDRFERALTHALRLSGAKEALF